MGSLEILGSKSNMDLAPKSGEAGQSASEQPPPYEIDQPRQEQLPAPEELPTLVLNGSQIFSASSPSRILYEISNPPCDASAKIYGIEKIRYRVADASSEPSLKSRVDHIYDFKGDWTSLNDRNVELIGKTSQKRTYPKLIMSQGLSTSSFKVTDLLRAEADLRGRLNQGRNNIILWKDADGQVIARESKLSRDKEGKVQDLPRLAIEATLEEKFFDLLVACWCARVWKEAEKDLKEPLSWGKC
ncbi:hypothetical protein QQZ08_009242 [Neonectria magnoliae]|uniref:Uncharacterized protein n=1 Tax=Neonectria magnoliae TaxID=2732573 RepID=A0ABR1HPB8_9HYPO